MTLGIIIMKMFYCLLVCSSKINGINPVNLMQKRWPNLVLLYIFIDQTVVLYETKSTKCFNTTYYLQETVLMTSGWLMCGIIIISLQL